MATNPYLQDQADAITNTVTRNLNNNILPQVQSQAVAAGGYGGSRQGIAESNAIGQTNQDLSNSLSSLYGNAWAQDQQNQLTQQGLNNNYALGVGNLGLGYTTAGNNYNLGLGGLDLQNQNQQNNFYTQNRSLDQSQAQLGANLYNQGNAGYVNQGTGITGIGTTQEQAPWTVTNNAGNAYNQFSGLGGTTTQTQNGSTAGSILGGALAGAQVTNNLGLGNSSQKYIQDSSGNVVLNPNYTGP